MRIFLLPCYHVYLQLVISTTNTFSIFIERYNGYQVIYSSQISKCVSCIYKCTTGWGQKQNNWPQTRETINFVCTMYWAMTIVFTPVTKKEILFMITLFLSVIWDLVHLHKIIIMLYKKYKSYNHINWKVIRLIKITTSWKYMT